MAENHKLWGGRFEASLEKWVEEFGASISFDQKMAEFDLKGSIAHVTMLGETGIIAQEEALQIKQGLEELLEEYKKRYEIMSEFAPKMLSAEEVAAILQEKFADVLATKNKGQIMKAVMGELKGKADGKVINQVVADLTK